MAKIPLAEDDDVIKAVAPDRSTSCACRKFKLDHIGDVVRPTLARATRALPFGRRAASARPSSTIGAPAMVHPVNLQRSRARSSKRLSTDSRGTVSHFAFAVGTPFDQHLPRACVHAASACGSEKRRKSNSEARCRSCSNISILGALGSLPNQSRRMVGPESVQARLHRSAMANRRDVVSPPAQFFRQHVNHAFSLR
jgi:hypothetical protein